MIEKRSNDAYLQELKRSFKQLGERIETGDESELLIWIIPSQLACSHRPLRHNRLYGGSALNLDVGATPLVIEWVDRIWAEGVRSIICLMSDKEVGFYGRLNLGASDLLEFYRQKGFAVASIPWKDPKHVRKDPVGLLKKEQEVSSEALDQFDVMQKPVLLHCSAGIDRSSPVAAFIRMHRL